MRTKKKILSAQLPATPCTPEMRDNLVKVAEQQGRSLADLQRSAISLFLSASVGMSNNNVDDTSIKELA